ncbi:MAG: hypothetical protein ACXWYS_00150 [Gaiellaceae bacterium]
MDGVCAECWGSKGGRPMGWKRQPPRGDDVSWWTWLDPFGCLPYWLLSMVAVAATLLRAVT